MRSIRPALFLLALTALAPALSAQEQAPAPAPAPAHKPFVFGLIANTTSIDPVAASREMIGTRSWGMQLDAGVSFARFLFAGVDMGPQFLSDRASFTQATTAGDKTSTASLIYFSAMAGARTPAAHFLPGLGATSLGLYGGASTTAGKRSIENCVDCSSETIVVPGGSFVQPTLVFGEGSSRLRVSDRYYLNGTGMRSVISAGVEFGAR